MTELEDRLKDLRQPSTARPAADLDALRRRSAVQHRRRTGRLVAVAAAAALLLVLGTVAIRPRSIEVQTVQPAAPTSGSDATAGTGSALTQMGPPTFWLDGAGPANPVDLDRTAETLRKRIAAAGVGGTTVAVLNGSVAVWMPSGGRETRDVLVAAARPGRVSIRPVRETLGDEGSSSTSGVPGTVEAPSRPGSLTATVPPRSPTPAPTPEDLGGPGAPAVLRARPSTGRQSQWYEVGPAVVDNTGIVAAQWQRAEEGVEDSLLVEIGAGAQGAFTGLVAACQARDAPCASGRIALVVDAEVVSTVDAAQVRGATLRVPVTSDAGGFSEDLVMMVLLGPALPVELELRKS